MSIPAPVKELWAFWRDIEAKTMRPVEVALVGPAGQTRDQFRDALMLGTDYPGRLRAVAPDATERVRPDLALVLLEAGDAPWRRPFDALERTARDRVFALVLGAGGDLWPARQRDAAAALRIPEEQVVLVAGVADLAGDLPERLAGHAGDLLIPLARQFPIFRAAASWSEIHSTAKQNAIVGLIPVPGGDMLIMTANQIKMVLRLAAMFDLPLNARRAREIVAVVGGGFGLRTLARQLVKVVPGPGWLIGGGMGYGGTLAMGRAALAYFRRTAAPSGHLVVHTDEASPDAERNGRANGRGDRE